MKERPIILYGPEVRAVNEGAKTQLRRPVDMCRPRQEIGFLGGEGDDDDPESWGYFFEGPDYNRYAVLARGLNERHNHGCISIRCPLGEVGERLWGRETWQTTTTPEDRDATKLEYAADWNGKTPGFCEDEWSWRSPVAIPRWASRINVEITEIRVQRLRDISDEDAGAEGVVMGLVPADDYGPVRVGYVLGKDDGRCILHSTEAQAFIAGWNEINGKTMAAEHNPWLWALTFRRVP